ncbi:MAG: CoA-binding protein [Phycisphaerales bacterium]|nr:CoA-binding protein [Phycisphaerales bacterium]
MLRTVAIVGASADRTKYGNKSVRAHRAEGWEVYPINPHTTEIEGLRAYPSLSSLPGPVGRVSLYLPPVLGRSILPEIAALRPAEFFVNPGAESDELLAEARRLGLEPILACSIVSLGRTPDDVDA